MKLIICLLFPLISGVVNETTPKLADKLKIISVNKCCGEDEIFHESECVKASSREITGEFKTNQIQCDVFCLAEVTWSLAYSINQLISNLLNLNFTPEIKFLLNSHILDCLILFSHFLNDVNFQCIKKTDKCNIVYKITIFLAKLRNYEIFLIWWSNSGLVLQSAPGHRL